ncbi:complex I subunit 5 family protein [Coralloluteibacterium thermophilus]|uniref:Complex I subunit 5 family protein n=1 Tax=Coralloluteibacterium thermophilum TaxID=2707049 RepID=A0ABV9NQ76_9GAMM
MNAFALAAGLALLAPLLVCALLPALGEARARQVLRIALPAAGLPALALGLDPSGTLDLPWLLLGTRLETSDIGRALLLLVGIAWTLAGAYAADRVEARLRGFAAWWLLALAGIQLAALAGDLASFYLGYAAMSLSAYGLVAHPRTPAAVRAARIYLAMTLLGEGALLAGVLALAGSGIHLLADVPGAAAPTAAAWLLLAGFGVKVGVAGLHLWLPVAHPAAPVPASAVLSGVIVKAGLLGLLRLVPGAALPEGAVPVLVGLGLFTAFYAVATGLPQTRLKTVLAYSTVSQMGLLFAAAALALAGPEADAALALVTLLVLHHGLNKAALFLAAGHVPLRGALRGVLFWLPALSLAGLPLLSGALAKTGLKAGIEAVEMPAWTLTLLSLSSVGTTLLMWRAWTLARQGGEAPPRVHPALPMLVLAGVVVPWLWAAPLDLAALPAPYEVWAAAWPLGLAALLAWAWTRACRPLADRIVGRVPEGDVLHPILALLAALAAAAQRLPRPPAWRPPERLGARLEAAIAAAETRLGTLAAAGTAVLALVALTWLGWR